MTTRFINRSTNSEIAHALTYARHIGTTWSRALETATALRYRVGGKEVTVTACDFPGVDVDVVESTGGGYHKRYRLTA